MVGKASKAIEKVSVSVETKWPGLKKSLVKMFFLDGLPRPRYARLGNLSTSEKHFSPRIFLSLAFCFYRHGTIILAWASITFCTRT